MKQIFLLSMICLVSFTFAQKKEYDQKITGCYKGSEQNQQVDGISKYWISCRLDKGRSILLFIAIDKDGKVTQTTENGSWWTNNGKYHELHNYDNVTDIYNYQILENGDVKFKSVELMGKEDSTYEFTDFKIEED